MDVIWNRAKEYFDSRPMLQLPEPARAHRRNLLAAAGIFTIYWGAGLEPTGFSAVFISFKAERGWFIEYCLLAILVYELLMFHTAKMAAEVKYLTKNEDSYLFKQTLNKTKLQTALINAKFGVHFENRPNYRIDVSDPNDERLVGIYTLKSVSAPNSGENTHDAVKKLKEVDIPGLVWKGVENGSYIVEYTTDLGADCRYLDKAFPRLRRLRQEAAMELGFPYFVFFLTAYSWSAVRIVEAFHSI